MSTSWKYPGSRIQGKNQCDLCKRGSFFGNNIWVEMTDSSGKTIKYLKQTCGYCGAIRFFDIELARSVKYHDTGINEVFPTE